MIAIEPEVSSRTKLESRCDSRMGFLHRLQTLGYPLVVDALQLTPDTPKPGAPSGMQPGVQPGMQPGMLKMSLTIVILNFDQWKEEKPHA